MFQNSEITPQSFENQLLEIGLWYDWISKIPSQGWQKWKNWLSTFRTFLDPAIFWYFFKISWIEKMTGAKKIIKVKNQFFHACQPREGIFEIRSYWGLIFTTDSLNFEELFPSFETFFQNFFLLKWFQMVSTLTGLMPLEIWQP